jgi:ABC-type glycerol-3-phosphate transport system permease component
MLGILGFSGLHAAEWQRIRAAAPIAMIPGLLLYVFLHERTIQALYIKIGKG